MKPMHQDSTVSSSQEIVFGNECLSESNHCGETAIDAKTLSNIVTTPVTQVPVSNLQTEKCKLTKLFPWITDFSKECLRDIGLSSIHTLENLMINYLHHISFEAAECYLKPNKAAKLKRTMNDTLLLFHLFYSDMKEPIKHSSYLDKMCELMAVYIDMEITASRRGKESLMKIACKLTSAIFLFLDKSQDHILDTLFKTKFMKKNYFELCNHIFMRVLRDSPGKNVNELTYVRYIFGFKMWKKIVRGREEKKNVMTLASTKLNPPPQFREKMKSGFLVGVLPKIPKYRDDITMFLMEAKFCIKEKTEAFLKIVSDPKLQGVLTTPTNFDSDLFYVNDTDISRHSSKSQVICTSDSITTTDFWSPDISEVDITDDIDIPEVLEQKNNQDKNSSINYNDTKSNLELTGFEMNHLKNVVLYDNNDNAIGRKEISFVIPISKSNISESCNYLTFNNTKVQNRSIEKVISSNHCLPVTNDVLSCSKKEHNLIPKCDLNTFTNQKCCSRSLNNYCNPLPFDSKERQQCSCPYCCLNLKTSFNGLNLLTRYNKAKGVPSDFTLCLPLKKRKHLSFKKEIIKQDKVSYPSTPMISVAVFENSKIMLPTPVTDKMALVPKLEALDYSVFKNGIPSKSQSGR